MRKIPYYCRHTLCAKTGLLTATIALSMLTVSCIDDNYNLSDIDTTTQLKVNDLTVPVNLKEIYLDNIIDLDDENPDATIKIRTVNGRKYYYISKGGNFTANPKNIEKVHAPAPEHIESSTITVNALDVHSSRQRLLPDHLEYTITPYHTTFDYRVGRDGNPKVDPAILYIEKVTTDKANPLHTTLSFSSKAIARIASRVEIHDLVITVPKGTTARYGAVKSENGKLAIPEITTTTGQLSLTIELDELDFATPESPDGKAVIDGCFDFSESVGVESGRFLVYPDLGHSITELPLQIDFTTDYDMSSFVIEKFSGVFDYAVDFDDIAPIELNDIPDFLAGEGTDISLAKPALILKVNSPVAKYGLECATGLTLTAERAEGVPSISETLDQFTITNREAEQHHVLAPSKDVLAELDVTANTIFTPYPGLGKILSGNGLPKIIRIDFTSNKTEKPRVFGHARDFTLGQPLDQVNGEYEFTSPLALADGSTIIYTTTEDGWNDDDVDAIAVTSLKVKAKVTSTIPAGAKLYIKPVDKNGNRIPLTNAESAFAVLPANANAYEISLELLGDIRHLDGVYIEAILNDFNGENLSPEATIKITDLRATVSGSYTKEF